MTHGTWVVRWMTPERNRLARQYGRMLGAVAAVVIAALALPAVASATTQTIDFEGLAPGTQVSNQFDSLGIDFVNGVVPATGARG